MDRQNLRDWGPRYSCGGIAELSDRRGKGAKPRLSPTQQARFVAWVEVGPNPVEDGDGSAAPIYRPLLANKEHLRANERGAEPAHLVIRVISGAIFSVPLVPPVAPPQG